MNVEPTSHREAIYLLGGPTEVARELSLKPSCVQQMSNRDSIPYWYWADFEQLAQKKNVQLTEDTLKRTAVRPKRAACARNMAPTMSEMVMVD